MISFLQVLLLQASLCLAQVAPGGPGVLGHSPSPFHEGYGTTLQQPLWFATQDGAVVEVAYPTVDLVQSRETFLTISDGTQELDERALYNKSARFQSTLAYQFVGQSRIQNSNLVVQKVVAASADNTSVVIDYYLQFVDAKKRTLTLWHKPSMAQTAGGDRIEVLQDSVLGTLLLAGQGDVRGDEPSSLYVGSKQLVAWSLIASDINVRANVGFEGVSTINSNYTSASDGNVFGRMQADVSTQNVVLRVVIAMGENTAQAVRFARASMQTPLADILQKQKVQWEQYLQQTSFDRADMLAETSVLILKAMQDKLHPGAFIAGPANPAIPWLRNAEEMNYENSRRRVGDSNAGYRRVWPRDLGQIAFAFLAINDLSTAANILTWYQQTQLADGTWSQNYFTDGTPSWRGFQIDQTGWPILVAHRLVKAGAINYFTYRPMILRAAQALLTRGPWTDQERWEENGGISPNSLAIATQALFAVAELESQYMKTSQNAELFLTKAQEWLQNIKKWTVVQRGALGTNYFMRLSTNGNPQDLRYYRISNKASGMQENFREDEIVDGGFLQWVLSGLMPANDAEVQSTLKIYDRICRAQEGYLRYNNDSYGEMHQGGVWPLLTIERMLMSLEMGQNLGDSQTEISRYAFSTGVLPEQTTLSASPLAWSHAAYLILQKSVKDRKSFYYLSR